MSDNDKDWGFDTRAIHTGQEPDASTGAVIPPVHLTTTYIQEAPGQDKGYDYSRSGHPTRRAYEQCLASLEGGRHGFSFASGCAAATTVLHLLKAGDHVVAGDDMYGGTFRLFEQVIKNNGIEFSYVDLSAPENLEQALQDNTRMVWLESPTNPLLKVIDIAALSDCAHQKNVMVTVDNTFMSPYFQNPLQWGADIVVHSTTKYIGGHSDIVGGAVVVNREDVAEKLAFLSKSMGPVPSPWDAYMSLRSLKTLSLRMSAHEKNAQAVVKFLSQHDKVKRVLYPGLATHPGHELAKKQMTGFGGMVSFYIQGGLEEAKTFLKNLKIFALAESLGGVESLIEHPALMTHASVPEATRRQLGIDDTLLRLSVGVETQKDLLADLDRGLKAT